MDVAAGPAPRPAARTGPDRQRRAPADGWARVSLPARAALLPLLLLLLLVACGGEDDANADVVRGRGLQVSPLPAATEARIDEAVFAAAFERGPGLTLLLHPMRLPRTATDTGAAPVPAALLAALRARGVVAGSCAPAAGESRDTPRCEAREAGYVVRVSDVFRQSADTVQVYLTAERYALPTGEKPEALRLEKVYQLVERDGSWRVAREARPPDAAP